MVRAAGPAPEELVPAQDEPSDATLWLRVRAGMPSVDEPTPMPGDAADEQTVDRAGDRAVDLDRVISLIERMARETGVPVRWRRTRPPPPP